MLAEVMAAKREISERTQGGRLRRIDPKFVQQVKETQAQAHLSDKEFARMLSISSFQLRNLYSRDKKRVGRPSKAKRATSKTPIMPVRIKREPIPDKPIVISGFRVTVGSVENAARILASLEGAHANP